MMFSSKSNNLTQKQVTKVDTLIGSATNMSGNINASGTVRIDGIYTGDITTDSDVIIGQEGMVKGNITSDTVSISGTVEGNINSENLIEVLATGKLFGDIQTQKLSISNGAVFNGKCSMVSEEVKRIPAPNTENEE